MRFLVVEDDDDHARIVRHALEDGGDSDRDIVRVGTLDEALERAVSDAFDLIILDYQLPDGTGLDVLDELREHGVNTPVLFLTGQGSEDVALQAMSRGAVDYLVKGPGVAERLQARVEEVLRGWSDVDELVSIQTEQVPRREEPGASDQEPSRPAPAQDHDQAGIEAVLEEIVVGPVRGALVVDGEGRPIAQHLPDWVGPPELGRVLRSVHRAIGGLAEVKGLRPRRYAVMVQTPETLVALSVAPGPLLVALLLQPSTGSLVGLRQAQEAAKRVWEAG